jgi:hypothetical protein
VVSAVGSGRVARNNLGLTVDLLGPMLHERHKMKYHPTTAIMNLENPLDPKRPQVVCRIVERYHDGAVKVQREDDHTYTIARPHVQKRFSKMVR